MSHFCRPLLVQASILEMPSQIPRALSLESTKRSIHLQHLTGPWGFEFRVCYLQRVWSFGFAYVSEIHRKTICSSEEACKIIYTDMGPGRNSTYLLRIEAYGNKPGNKTRPFVCQVTTMGLKWCLGSSCEELGLADLHSKAEGKLSV